MSVPVMESRKGYQQQIRYVPISIGYAMWTPEKSKLELATELLGEIMPMLKDKQVILCFDSWYAKKKLIYWALSYNNVNILCNARHDTFMWDLPEPISGKRGRPKKYGDKLSLDSINDFHGEGKEEAFFYPLKLYKLRWSIETNYY